MTSSPSPTRRTLVRTAAWSVPAVVAVTAAPAYAASGNPSLAAASASWVSVGDESARLRLAISVTSGGTALTTAFRVNALLPMGIENVQYRQLVTPPSAPWNAHLSFQGQDGIQLWTAVSAIHPGLSAGETATLAYEVEVFDGSPGGNALGDALTIYIHAFPVGGASVADTVIAVPAYTPSS